MAEGRTAVIELPENLGDDALTDRLSRVFAHRWGIPADAPLAQGFAEDLLPEVRRIVVDTLLHVVGELAESDGCQDFPFELAEEFDAEHLHVRLARQERAAEAREAPIPSRSWQACTWDPWKASDPTRANAPCAQLQHRYIPNIGWQHLALIEDVKQDRVLAALRVLTGEAP